MTWNIIGVSGLLGAIIGYIGQVEMPAAGPLFEIVKQLGLTGFLLWVFHQRMTKLDPEREARFCKTIETLTADFRTCVADFREERKQFREDNRKDIELVQSAFRCSFYDRPDLQRSGETVRSPRGDKPSP